jgi:release factor glutamine methyltransferase
MKVGEVSSLFQEKLKDKYPETEIGNFIFFTLQSLLGFSRIDVVLKKEEEINEKKLPLIKDVLEKIKNDNPIQYILGSTEFYRLKFKVTPDVLIPRPETEELVDLIIKENKKPNPLILDIGTGSGCIAVSLKRNIPDSFVYGIDISPDVLAIAKENAQINNTDIIFLKHNILHQKESYSFPEFDIIVSNPPYVLESEKKVMKANVIDHEPNIALFVPDEDPFMFYNAIAKFAIKHIKPGGLLYFEINERFAFDLELNLKKLGLINAVCFKDINNKDRILKYLGIKKRKTL